MINNCFNKISIMKSPIKSLTPIPFWGALYINMRSSPPPSPLAHGTISKPLFNDALGRVGGWGVRQHIQ